MPPPACHSRCAPRWTPGLISPRAGVRLPPQRRSHGCGSTGGALGSGPEMRVRISPPIPWLCLRRRRRHHRLRLRSSREGKVARPAPSSCTPVPERSPTGRGGRLKTCKVKVRLPPFALRGHDGLVALSFLIRSSRCVRFADGHASARGSGGARTSYKRSSRVRLSACGPAAHVSGVAQRGGALGPGFQTERPWVRIPSPEACLRCFLARVGEWHSRPAQTRGRKTMQVRVLPRAPWVRFPRSI